MSRRRPTNRDRLEREYLALAEEFAAVRRDFETRLAAKQREIQRIEDGGAADDGRRIEQADGARKDALDHLPEARLSVLPAEVDEVAEEWPDREEAQDDGYRLKAVRAMALLLGVCRLVTHPDENQPKLTAHIVMIAADLPGASSMRQVAELYGLSPERVSQRVEDVQRRFNLPKNQHNKSASAVAAYRVNAALINQPKSAA